jgi:hypothetical protein
MSEPGRHLGRQRGRQLTAGYGALGFGPTVNHIVGRSTKDATTFAAIFQVGTQNSRRSSRAAAPRKKARVYFRILALMQRA